MNIARSPVQTPRLYNDAGNGAVGSRRQLVRGRVVRGAITVRRVPDQHLGTRPDDGLLGVRRADRSQWKDVPTRDSLGSYAAAPSLRIGVMPPPSPVRFRVATPDDEVVASPDRRHVVAHGERRCGDHFPVAVGELRCRRLPRRRVRSALDLHLAPARRLNDRRDEQHKRDDDRARRRARAGGGARPAPLHCERRGCAEHRVHARASGSSASSSRSVCSPLMSSLPIAFPHSLRPAEARSARDATCRAAASEPPTISAASAYDRFSTTVRNNTARALGAMRMRSSRSDGYTSAMSALGCGAAEPIVARRTAGASVRRDAHDRRAQVRQRVLDARSDRAASVRASASCTRSSASTPTGRIAPANRRNAG